MHSYYLDAIRNFEGFTPQAKWDYAQLSNGYGTKALFAGEVIDRTEADRRFRTEIASARTIVDKAVPDLDEGTKAALTSLTYNAGTSWISSGLGDAVRRGDLETARDIFLQYNKAGGEVLPGLVSRRTQEAFWIGSGTLGPAGAQPDAPAPSGAEAALPPVVVERAMGAQRVAELIAQRAPPVSDTASAPLAASATASAYGETPSSVVGRAVSSGALGNVTSEALIALIDVDRLGAGGVADFSRLAQLGRGSELRSDGKDRQNDEARRA